MKRTRSPGSRRRQAEAKPQPPRPLSAGQGMPIAEPSARPTADVPTLSLPALLQVRDEPPDNAPSILPDVRKNLLVRQVGRRTVMAEVHRALLKAAVFCRQFFTRPAKRSQAVRHGERPYFSLGRLWAGKFRLSFPRLAVQSRSLFAGCKSRPLASLALAGVLSSAFMLQSRDRPHDLPLIPEAEVASVRGPAGNEAAEVDLDAEGEVVRADDVTQQLREQAAALVPATAGDPFTLPASVRPAVAFWQRVFGVWDAGDVVLHDTEHLGIVYEVIDLPEGAGGARLTPGDQRVVDQRKRVLCANLNDLEYRLRVHLGLTKEQQRLYRLVTAIAGRNAVHGAAQRVRIQRGMRNSFRQGLAASGRYESSFRQVFRENGLPEDLVFLAHVESAFTSSARSPVGAIGVWQFMPETGKRFLKITNSLDERYDPILATRGAARYFALAFAKLEDWGLAITSFNYGLSGMLKAKAECGVDFDCVARRYDAPNFGFASRNYYPEFLAIRSIVQDLNKYFPNGINFAPPLPHKRVRLTRSVAAQDVARAHGLTLQDLVEINPAWTSAAAQGRVALPADAEIWVPADAVVNDATPPGMIARVEGGAASHLYP